MFLKSQNLSLLGILCGFCVFNPAESLAREHSTRRQTIESAMDRVKQIKGAAYLEACDQKYLNRLDEIADAVDRHQSVVAEYKSKHPYDPKYFLPVKLDPITVREALPSYVPREGWQVDELSWTTLIQNWEHNRDSRTLEQWSQFSDRVITLLDNDLDRVVWGADYSVGYQDEPRLEKIAETIRVCQRDPLCSSLKFETQDLLWMESQRNLATTLEVALKPDLTIGDRAKAWAALQVSIQSLLEGYFQFRPNPKISRKGNQLILPVWSSQLNPRSKEMIGDYVTQIWSKPGLSVKLEWAVEADPDLFSILVSPGVIGRSYVSYNKNTVNFFDYVRANSIAHEFGHVLGFRDRYYTVWDKEKCVYYDQYREDDIMSESTKAHVQQDEWEALEKFYPEVSK